MKRLLVKLLLYNLIFINATAFLSDYNLDVIPEHYNLKLEPYFEVKMESFNFFGRCEAYVNISIPTYSISLNAQKPQIEILNTIVTNRESFKIYEPSDITYKNESHILTFHFDDILSKGHYLLNMSFIGLTDNYGIVFFRTYTHFNTDKRLFVAIQLGAIGARQLFPCWDEPAFKATFNISVRHYMGYSVWSTMPIREETVDKNDMVWTHFKITRSMPTYLISLLLYDSYSFPIIEYDRIYNMLFHLNTKFARRIIQNVTRRFEIEWMAYSQNLSSTNHLIIPAGPQHNSMGHILYRASNVFYINTLDPISNKIKTACLIAHEVALQWINNLVSPSSWSDFWLNEGIARLLGMDMIDKIFQDSNYTSILDLFAVQSKLESLQLDHYLLGIMDPLIPKINKTSEIESLFSFSYYIKAPVILRILRQHLLDELYLHGIEIFLNEHMFSSVTIDDFWGAMQDALYTAERNIFHVKWLMNAWTNQKHYPMLKVEYSNCTSLRISIDNFYQLVNDDWLLPIIIITIKWKENILKSIKMRYTYNKVQNNISYIEIDE
ncbi:glutamyl aminopeptidase-like, partial [Nylanderia fulva]|uniref:glutamyl aminopeptidase-like n=1 Tax=Nylanderia fulva TaxID=613905 RepID=UPI0010FB82A1